jgi:hypothetical protein
VVFEETMIAIKHFRQIIRDALDPLKLYSTKAEELLVITAAQESLGGTYLWQNDRLGFPKGPALGVYQMEPVTYRDLFENYLRYNRRLQILGGLTVEEPERMVYDIRYATVIARLNYYRFPAEIPEDLEGQLRYYKKYWNTELGKATIAEARKNYERFLQAA